MKPNQLKKLMTQLDISQADLSRICFDQVTQSDRVIVSTWLNGVKPIPRWVKQMLTYYRLSQPRYLMLNKELNNE